MRSLILVKILILAFLISGQTEFRLNGEHKFTSKNAESWSVSKKEINQESGKSKVKKNIANGSGDSAKLYLKQKGKKATIYSIIFKGKDFSETKNVRVFEPNKLTSFFYESNNNPIIKTYLYIPKSLSSQSKLLFIMHGMKRRPEKYIVTWEDWAEKNNYILVGPTFDAKNWVRARSYNFGNMFSGNNGKGDLNPSSNWSYQIVEDIFNKLHKGFGLENNFFHIYGHSAGAQFVHRFTFFVPNSKVKFAISANSGWYTLPSLETKYPYGLKHSKLNYTEKDLQNWSKKNLTIMRGTADLIRSKLVRKTKEADEQGQNRFERGGYMFDMMKKKYPQTNWRLVDVPKVPHSQKRMAIAAQRFLEQVDR